MLNVKMISEYRDNISLEQKHFHLYAASYKECDRIINKHIIF